MKIKKNAFKKFYLKFTDIKFTRCRLLENNVENMYRLCLKMFSKKTRALSIKFYTYFPFFTATLY